MVVSKKLQRQFKKAFGAVDFDQELVGVMNKLKVLPSLTPDQEALLKYIEGFQVFIETVQASYDQSEKMLEISNRSLSVSSEELNLTNSKLKDLNRTVEAMLSNLGEGIKAAREIQQSLIPPRHQVFEEVLIDVLYHPSEELSGDFFDVYKKDEWLYFYIADVTSHGTASAQVTYLIKGIFQDIITNSPIPPTIDFLIKDFARRYVDYKLAYSVGLQMYRINLKEKTIESCAGNAPPPICIRAGIGKQISVNPGPLIDAVSFDLNYIFAPQIENLLTGDTIYCFTDGAFELNNTGDASDFNERKFAKILEKTPFQDWEAAILKSLQKVAGKDNFDDDITILRVYLK